MYFFQVTLFPVFDCRLRTKVVNVVAMKRHSAMSSMIYLNVLNQTWRGKQLDFKRKNCNILPGFYFTKFKIISKKVTDIA